MDDIVERLADANLHDPAIPGLGTSLCREARQEILSLRARLEQAVQFGELLRQSMRSHEERAEAAEAKCAAMESVVTAAQRLQDWWDDPEKYGDLPSGGLPSWLRDALANLRKAQGGEG